MVSRKVQKQAGVQNSKRQKFKRALSQVFDHESPCERRCTKKPSVSVQFLREESEVLISRWICQGGFECIAIKVITFDRDEKQDPVIYGNTIYDKKISVCQKKNIIRSTEIPVKRMKLRR